MALYCSPDYQTSLCQLAFRFTRESSILIFKMVAILDIQSERFSLLLIYKTPRYFQKQFESTSLLVQEKKVQNRFSTWLLGRPSWISDQNDFSYF